MNSQALLRTKTCLPLLLLTLLAACGGGGGGGSGGSTISSLSGTVMDGYITGATVCLDLNNNGKCDGGEPSTTTGANGSYTFNYTTTALSTLNVIATVPVGATDSDNPGTPIASAYQLLAPATQPLVLSPLTTLVSQYVVANPGITATNAASSVVAALGLPSSTNLFQDYVGTNNTAVHNVAKVVNTVVQNSNLGSTPTKDSLNAAVSVAATYTSAATAASSTNIGSLISSATVAAAGANGNLINSAPTPTYTSANLSLFTQLNAIRKNAGAGALVQNSALDTAALNHTNYLINHNLVADAAYLTSAVSGVTPTISGGHYENSSLSAYSGTTPLARTTAAGYSGASVNELISFGAASVTECSASIENSVYHLVALISPFYDLGLAYNAPNSGGSVCDIELGISTASGQYPPSGSFVSYPANAQTGVPPKFYNQAESPVPAADLAFVGHPVVMSLYNQTNKSLLGSDIVVSAFTLTGSSAVASRVLAQSGVGASGITLTVDENISAPGILVLLPTSPLAANTTYTVNFSATVKHITTTGIQDTPVSKTWSFSTGSQN
jgi:uncharacterized protein YkwD